MEAERAPAWLSCVGHAMTLMRPSTRGTISGLEGRHPATKVHLRMHPRVFAALGADLVTNDTVAVIELVKNSYDAYANNVWVRIGLDDDELYLEVEDDGQGMTRAIIADVWCLVATPYKALNRNVVRDGATRRVSGAKGLGRLAVGRLGERLTLLTRAKGNPCWQVKVNWDEVTAGDDLADSTVELRRRPSGALRHRSGTLVKVHALRNEWDRKKCEELEDNLSRLISPFQEVDDFAVHLSIAANGAPPSETTVSSPPFFAKPKYSICGEANDAGDVNAIYRFRAINTNQRRDREVNLPWRQVDGSEDHATCGPFSFDIRAWDISQDGTHEIAERYGLQKRNIRSAIRAHKGISVYRDGVLVLPKSESAHDWLGLDLRRVSRVGDRVSTNQLVGYVSITADQNPGIEDTSDRERLASSKEVIAFQKILTAVVVELERGRDEDRAKEAKETPMEDLLGAVSAQQAFNDVRTLARTGASAKKAVPILRSLDKSLEKTRKNIERRFIYYSRLATVGTVAHMLVHEIRNRTTAIAWFLRLFEEWAKNGIRKKLGVSFNEAGDSVHALERLADVFAPLANRNFRRGARSAVLEERIRACLKLQAEERRSVKVRCRVPDTETSVAVDPGELDAVILNLVTNAVYWLREVEVDARLLEFELHESSDSNRVVVRAFDTGPGIAPEDMERVFWPGVTRKPNGIGMGLTVASEIVAAYGGQMAVEDVDTGACFTLDLPLARR